MSFLALSLLAGGVLVALLARGDRQKAVLLLLFTAAGAASIAVGLVLYAVAGAFSPLGPGRWGQIVFVWTVNAPVEELAKYLCFAAVTLLGTIKRPQDGIAQGAATGLGFALVENILYGLDGGWPLFLLRTLVSLPGHVVYGAVWGGYHGFEVYQGGGRLRRWWVPALALIPASFSHALFNTLVLVEAPLPAALCADGLMLGFGLFLSSRLRVLTPGRYPLRQWRQAIPEMKHALALQPHSEVLKRQLAAYLLAAKRPQEALSLLETLPEHPWTRFYADAARCQLSPPAAVPPSAALNPRLFQTLSRG